MSNTPDTGIDDFLASALAPATPERLSASFRFAELDMRQVQDALVVIPADEVGEGFCLSADVLAVLRGEIQAWFKSLREQGQMVTDLISASVRDLRVRQITQRLLEAAYKAPSHSWMTGLPTGRQIVIAPTSVVEIAGFEGVCRVAHERAIRTAQAHGRPFNTQALSHYQSLRPMETAQ